MFCPNNLRVCCPAVRDGRSVGTSMGSVSGGVFLISAQNQRNPAKGFASNNQPLRLQQVPGIEDQENWYVCFRNWMGSEPPVIAPS